MTETLVPTSVTFGGHSVYDPRSLYNSASRHGWDTSWFGKPTSYTCPLGSHPGIGHILLPRKHLEGLSTSLSRNTPHDLKFRYGKDIATIKNLYIVNAQALYFGPSPTSVNTAHDDNAYLVELADVRRLFQMTSIVKSFNVRRPAPHVSPAPLLTPAHCYQESLEGSSLWTWETLCSWLWGQLPGSLGGFPGLPSTSTIPPEGYRFHGVSAWDALCLVLDQRGFAFLYNPLTAAFSVVDLKNDQADFNANINGLARFRMADHSPLAGRKATCPYKIKVCFHRRDAHYGTEPETPILASWEANSVYVIEKLTGFADVDQKTALTIWDDLPALVQPNGVVNNEISLQARATALVDQTVKRINKALEGKRSAYFGIHTTILPGSQISYVKWCDDGYSGMYTEYGQNHAPYPPNQTMPSAGGVSGLGGAAASSWPLSESPIFPSRENLAPPDFSRHSHPVFPRLAQLVEVAGVSPGQPTGSAVPRNTWGLWPGKVIRLDPDADLTLSAAFQAVETCWLYVENLSGGSTDPAATLQVGDRYTGRLSGSTTADGSARPLYVIRKTTPQLVDGVPFINEHQSVAPYGAMMQVLGTTTQQGTTYLRCSQPLQAITDFQGRGDVPRIFAVNKSTDVPYQGSGLCTYGPNVEVLIAGWSSEQGTFKQGDVWGPVAGSWAINRSSFLYNASLQGEVRPAEGAGGGHNLAWGWLHPVVFLNGRVRNVSSGVLTINTDMEVQVEINLGTHQVQARNKMTALRVPANASRNVFLYRHNVREWWITAFQC